MDRGLIPRLWERYGRHAELVFRGGPRPAGHTTPRSFLAMSGADHVDLNQAALFGDATPDDAAALVASVLDGEAPCLLACSDGVLGRVAAVLAAAGFEQLPQREALFRQGGSPPPASPSAFAVRRVRTAVDVDAMRALFAEAHGYDPALIDRLYGERVRADDGFSAWIAWDGPEPVSFAIVTETRGSLALWDVMTPVRHRRRGGARAVISHALAEVAATSTASVEETIFWSTPLGRPLYEAMGFVIADDVDAWTLGASPEDLAAVGA